MTIPSDYLVDPSSSVVLARTFVDFARSVSEGADIVDVYSMLSERCVEVLSVAACGILLVDLDGGLRVIGSSSHSAELLDLFQAQNEVGPCHLCCRTGDPVADDELSETGPWPKFAALVRRQGFTSVNALPLRAQDRILGALNLFSSSMLESAQLAVAQAMADAATVALLQSDPHDDAVGMTRRLHLAVEARSAVDQAIGIIAQRFTLSVDEALVRLRSAADDTGSRLVDVASAVVARDGGEPMALRRPTPD